MKKTDAELAALRQLFWDAQTLDALVAMCENDLRQERDELLAEFNATPEKELSRRQYLLGLVSGMSAGLKAMAGPLDFGSRWIRAPKRSTPQLKLVVDNTKKPLIPGQE